MSRGLPRRAWLQAAAAGALGLAGAPPACRRRREPARHGLHLACPGADEGLHAGLALLLTDHLEALGSFTLVRKGGALSPGTPSGPILPLRVEAAIHAGTLALDLEAELPGRTVRTASGPRAPLEAFRWLCGALGIQGRRARPEDLCPADPGLFPEVLRMMAGQDDAALGRQTFQLYQRIREASPDCATAHLLLGGQLYNQLLLHPLEQENQWRAFQAYRQALAALPGHPRGSEGFGRLLADAGLHREALDLLEGALRIHPSVPRLYAGLCYVARTCGLLDLARKSLREVERLTYGRTGLSTENAYLYLGEMERFLGTCAKEGTGRDTRVGFYLGYVALARGDRPAALREFQAAAAVPGGWYGFEALSTLFAEALEGRAEAAGARLQALAQQKSALRAPDGEFTFKLAEAAAFLGNRDRAAELAELAFTQGFGCTRWYEQSPLFAPVRLTDRWAPLHQHLRERESLLASRFPPRRFNL